jgi:hypothetical protein
VRTLDTLAHPPSELEAGEGQEGWGAGDAVLGRFRLERLLGTGGFGAVWRATDERLRRPVAVKVIPHSATGGARGRREALAVARLNHPAIVALYEEGEDDRALYLVSELVEGSTLADLEAAGALSDREVVRLGIALCDALLHAHAHGVVHRDLKPQNVLVPRRGGAKLADFGVARLIGDEPLTRTGDVLGTLAYMAPEQAAGRRTDGTADLYGLGLVLYEALAGVNPVRAATPASTTRRIGRPLPPLRRLRRDLPESLAEAIDTAVQPRPAERGTVEGLRAGLQAACSQVSDADGALRLPLPTAVAPVRVPARVLAGAAAGALAAACLALAGPPPPVPVLPAALAATVVVALLPRAGWLAAAALGVVWLAGSRPGAALLLGAALAAPVLALPRRPAWWSVPVLAPLLGLAALAPAYCAVAAQAPSARSRAALGAAGLWWLCLAEPALGRDLYLGRAPGTAAPDPVLDSTGRAVDALSSLIGSGALSAALLWALAAAALPPLTARGGLAAAATGAALWAAALAAGTLALGHALDGAVALPDPRGAIAGAVAGALFAVALRALREPARAGSAAMPTA